MSFVGWMIIACEIAFWVVILTGLAVRYILKKKKLGFLLLALTPVIDLTLLIVTGLDLWRGAKASYAHALAAVYLGVSVAYGKSMIAWADERFRYYVMKEGTKPIKRYGREYARHYFKSWIQHVLAYMIGGVFLLGLVFLIDDPSRTAALTGVFKLWSLIVGIDFLIAISHFIWPARSKMRIK
ncbi:hypothetical protein [Bacillus xiapuensis]|uniref:hypothetical protein n=1 Tax=Bacillus xiapuensis TaxID=2014075 RepID=UPI000C236B82|nr:hypothetical protein [Bacillus xiapuensis]